MTCMPTLDQPFRIMIADDDPRARLGLFILLSRQSHWQVVAEVADVGALRNRSRTYRPDIILLAWELPPHVDAALLSDLRGIHEPTWIVALSLDTGTQEASLAAGVDAFIGKWDASERLLPVRNGLVAAGCT